MLAALYFGKAILVPIVLSALLSLFLRPAVTFLERYVGRIGAVIASVTLSMVLMLAAGYGMGAKIAGMASDIPIYKERILLKVEALKQSTHRWVGDTIQVIDDFNNNLSKSNVGNTKTIVADSATPDTRLSVAGLAAAVLGPLVEPMEMGMIVLIFTVFILIQRDDLRNRIVRLAGTRKMHVTSQAFDEAGRKLSHYLLTQLLINLAYGFSMAIGLYGLGVQNSIVWGILAAVLRFVPYIGTWIAAIPPFVILLATTNGWQPAYVIGLVLFLDVVFPTAIEPLLIGSGMGISPLSLLVAAVFWSWMWGFAGLLLSTPLTVCLAVMGSNMPQLKFLDILLTNKAILDPKSHFYQQLLSLNRAGALDVINRERQSRSTLQICDDVLMPVLSSVERDLWAGRIDEERAQLVRTTVSEWVTKQNENNEAQASVKMAKVETSERFSALDLQYLPEGAILCIPAHNEADELTAQLFAATLKQNGLPASATSFDQLAGEVLRSISERQTGVVCICALPPFAVAHSRYLYKRIRTLFPAIVILVGLWDRKNCGKFRRELECVTGRWRRF